MEVYSVAVTYPETGPMIPELYGPKFEYALQGKPDGYKWRFIPEGDFWYEISEGKVVFAPHDLVELYAFRNV